MKLVTCKHESVFEHQGYAMRLAPPAQPSAPTAEDVYLVFDSSFRVNAPHYNEVRIAAGALPPRWSAAELARLSPAPADAPPLRLLVLNGVGGGYGDVLVGAAALHHLAAACRRAGRRARLDLLVHETGWAANYEILKLHPDVHRVVPLGMRLAEVAGYDYLIDNENFVRDPAFGETPMLAYFQRTCGLDPAACPAGAPLWLSPPARRAAEEKAARCRAAHGEEPFIALNLFASPPREIPQRQWRPLLEAVAGEGTPLLVGGPADAPRLAAFLESLPPKLRDRCCNAAPFTARSFDHLLGLLHHLADAAVTPDTSVLHAAGRLDVPTVGVFVTVPPELRTDPYPRMAGYCPPAWRENWFFGRGTVRGEELDRIRASAELRELWEAFSPAEVVAELRRVRALPATPPAVPASPYVEAEGALRVLVYANADPANPADLARVQAFRQALPPGAEVEVVPLTPWTFRSLARADAVVVGLGGALDPECLRQQHLPAFLAAARRLVVCTEEPPPVERLPVTPAWCPPPAVDPAPLREALRAARRA